MIPDERLQWLESELALDPQHKRAFQEYAHIVRLRMQLMHQAVGPLIAEARSSLASRIRTRRSHAAVRRSGLHPGAALCGS